MNDDYDYDVSHVALNDYLAELQVDLSLESDVVFSRGDDPEHHEHNEPIIKSNSKNKKIFNRFFIYLFFNPKKHIEYLNSDVLLTVIESDKKFLLETYLNLLNHVVISLGSKDFLAFMISNRIPLLFYLFISFALSTDIILYLIFPCFYICFALLTFSTQSHIAYFIAKNSAKLTFDYLNLAKDIVYYLKEVQLVSMANQRRVLIEDKVKLNLDDTEIDLINYPFRKLVFKCFRKQFYEMKSLCKSQLDLIDCELLDLDKSSFICSIRKSELADVLQETESDSKLNKLSDYFSLNCLKSLAKLIRFEISEHFKLNQLIKINFIFSPSSLFTAVLNSTKHLIFLIKINLLFRKFNSDVKNLWSICQMIKRADDSVSEPVARKSKENELENILLNYARNTLLDCYRLRNLTDLTDKEKKKEILKQLKYDFEYCDLYLKKIQHKIEPYQKMNLADQKANLNANESIKESESVNQNLPFIEDTIQEDVIYEADIINDEIKNIKDESEEFGMLLRDKEANLVNKNLFYELKFALKRKKNEWNERERKAKRINDNGYTLTVQCPSDEQKLENDMFSVDPARHLLENDAYKHKSKIKKIKIQSNTDISLKKLEPNEEIFDLIDTNPKNLTFLSELMNKRNTFYNNEEDEIVYE